MVHYNGSSLSLNIQCMSHTNFQLGEVLEVAIFEDMIMVTPALKEKIEH